MKLYMAVALPAFLISSPYLHVQAHTPAPAQEWVSPKPVSRISYGQGIDLIVKGLGLNIDNMRFIKVPKATDYYKYANNNAPYASALIIAANKGVQSGRDLRPELPATREQFALALYEAIQGTGQYPVNMMWLNIKDEKEFGKDALNAVQTLIKFNVVSLKDGSFRPKAYITAAEARQMVKLAANFVQAQRAQAERDNAAQDAVTITVTPVNNQVSKVVLSAGNQPNSGYRLQINSIVFTPAKEAVIHYTLVAPDPNSMNLQVITEVKAETFVAAGYKVTATSY
ncbi:protease complex subunit PrcB family protein [Chitinophaga sp. 30R24]|uniref:protease complex subunit PrcB family protein n=1 Tax=Chitinophaga sp. 30R24 TaxID=3248838 RepID=UPI003B90ECB9